MREDINLLVFTGGSGYFLMSYLITRVIYISPLSTYLVNTILSAGHCGAVEEHHAAEGLQV